jgi:hypothetical protein
MEALGGPAYGFIGGKEDANGVAQSVTGVFLLRQRLDVLADEMRSEFGLGEHDDPPGQVLELDAAGAVEAHRNIEHSARGLKRLLRRLEGGR